MDTDLLRMSSKNTINQKHDKRKLKFYINSGITNQIFYVINKGKMNQLKVITHRKWFSRDRTERKINKTYGK